MILRKLIERAARSYVAGTDVSEALACVGRIERDGMSSTIAYWNARGEDPARVHAACQATIEGIAAAGTHTYLSIKAPALALSPALVDALAQRCREHGIGLHFDSLDAAHQTAIFALIERVVPTGVAVGCTLPGRFARSLDDARSAIEHRLRVRVVKGQWADPQHTIEPRRGFLAVIDRLAGRAAHVAVATHEAALAEEALTTLAARGTPAELELLFGLPMRQATAVARRLNVPVRVYVPYGHAWLPYALSSALESPRVLAWLLADAVRGMRIRAGERS